MRPRSIAEIAGAAAVIPVLTLERIEDAVPLAEALFKGGLSTIEITLRSEVAIAAIARVREALPELVLGVGTIMRPQQLEEIGGLGADFAVSPGATQELLAAARSSAIPFLPGAATASEIMTLAAGEWRHVKFFPAETAGGIEALRAFAAVFPKVRFCPTGGINETNAADYLALDNVDCVGGSWIAPPAIVRNGDWGEVRRRAEQARRLGHPGRSAN